MQKVDAQVYSDAWTYEEFMQLPEDRKKHELIKRELVVSPSPEYKHQKILTRLLNQMFAYAEKRNGEVVPAPMDVRLDEDLVVQPDIIYISEKNRDIIKDRVDGSPDLIAEILSKSSTLYDRRRKKKIYEEYAIEEYLIVSPEDKTIDYFRLKDKKYAFVGKFKDRLTVLDGLEIDIKAIF